jgi:hypothetical protein
MAQHTPGDPFLELMQSGEEEEELFLQMLGTKILSARSTHSRQRLPNKPRDPEGRYRRLQQQYFCANPIYSDDDFRRRFRMTKALFTTIYDAVVQVDPYFEQRPNAAGKLGLHPLLKITAALRMLAYGSAADAVDENLEVSEAVALESLRRFCLAVVKCFGPEYLREPSAADMADLLRHNSERGFPGMLGSLDCMHWTWHKCPTAHAGQYTGKSKKPTVVLEAWADHTLRIWHCNFGFPGSLNDLNILHRSSLFDSIMEGRAPTVEYAINGTVPQILPNTFAHTTYMNW